MKRGETIFHNLRRNKTLLCLSMVFMLVVSISIPIKVKAANDDFVITDGVLIAYCGSDSEVVIPKGVTSIGDNVF